MSATSRSTLVRTAVDNPFTTPVMSRRHRERRGSAYSAQIAIDRMSGGASRHARRA
jgi:hypothetical protein